uniref:Uncharacterized protein n=1 Tax=Arundo donax TaxID=35708 RepID=A0A0A8ZM72_ARUDO
MHPDSTYFVPSTTMQMSPVAHDVRYPMLHTIESCTTTNTQYSCSNHQDRIA